jgi:integrase/recombinase XerD
MGKFRDRMWRELCLHGYAKGTKKAYLGSMHRLVKHFMQPPDKLSQEDVVEYFQALACAEVSVSSFNQAVSGARVLFKEVLKRDWSMERIRYHRAPVRLPVVLAEEEVERLLDAAESLRDRVLFEIGYGTGLRINEVLSLLVSDIDSYRMTIRVEQGKGRKDRYVPLPRKLLKTLRDYYRQERPRHFLFPSPCKPGQPLNATTVGHVFNYARHRARIEKPATYHSLRHSYATRQVEAGVRPDVLQRLLGHRSLATTARYLHVAGDHLTKTESPLDTLHSKKQRTRKRRKK